MLPMMLGRSIANQRLTRVHVNIYFLTLLIGIVQEVAILINAWHLVFP